MFKYLQRRVIQAIPTFFGVTILSYLVILTAPGDPVAMITFSPNPSAEAMAAMRRQLGLDQPPLLQYVYWLIGNDWTTIDIDGDGVGERPGQRRGLLRGDLGNSIKLEVLQQDYVRTAYAKGVLYGTQVFPRIS